MKTPREVERAGAAGGAERLNPGVSGLMSTKGNTTLRWLLVVVMHALVGCYGAEPQRVEPVDNSPVVEIARESLAEAPGLELVEGLRLGTREQEERYVFISIHDVAVGPDGHVFVLDRGIPGLLHFDPDGAFLSTIGREGEGPGEFRSPRAVAVGEDTVYVLSDRNVHAFAFDGSHHYSRLVDPVVTGRSEMMELTWSAMGLVTSWGTLPARRRHLQRSYEHTDSIILTASDTSSPLFRETGAAFVGMTLSFRNDWIFQKLFAGVPEYAVMRDGTVVYSRGDEYLLEIRALDGTRMGSVRGLVPLQPVGREEREDFIERTRQFRLPRSIPGEEAVVAVADADVFRSVPYADHRAVLGRIFRGSGSAVLVERLDVDDLHPVSRIRASTWDVVTLDGRVLGRVTLPADFWPLTFAGSSVYGWETYELVPTVVRYDLYKEGQLLADEALSASR